MRWQGLTFLFVTSMLGVAGCQTHHASECHPPCTEADRASFVQCVAEGSAACAAGNRRCCATSQECIGTLEDQTVVTDAECVQVVEDACWRPCFDMDQVLFDGCLRSGSATCTAGDDLCCGDGLDCLGELVIDDETTLVISAEGCCSDDDECADDEHCDTETWECAEGVATGFCGDEIVQPTEACDDGDPFTNECDYGAMSCEVCTEDCVLGPGDTSFCGDGEIDVMNDEECEPPGTSRCDPMCFLPPTGDCFNMTVDGDETDVDCGGSCLPCPPGARCLVSEDCGATPMPLCSSTPLCDPDRLRCLELVCDDGIACTIDECLVGTAGCSNIAPDLDGDGFDCVEDCDDTDRAINPDLMGDDGCDLIDNDCDTRIDEDC